MPDDVVGNLIQLISDASTYHAYTVHLMWRQLVGDLDTKQPFVQVALWVIGEYADMLSEPDPESNDKLVVDGEVVIKKCESIINSNLTTLVTKEYASSALMKLSVRFPLCSARIKIIVDGYGCHMNTELQQRAIEFSTLFTKYDNLRSSLLEKMPPMKPSDRKMTAQNGQATHKEVNGDLDQDLSPVKEIPKSIDDGSSSALLDLLSLELSPTSPVSSPSVDVSGSQPTQNSGLFDFLGGLDMNGVSGLPSVSLADSMLVQENNVPVKKETNVMGLFDGLGTNGIEASQAKAAKQIMNVFDKDGLKLTFEFGEASEPSTAVIIMSASNSNSSPMSEFLFQAAVPKVSLYPSLLCAHNF